MSPLNGSNDGSCGERRCSLCNHTDFRPKAFPPRDLVTAGVLSALVRVVDQAWGRWRAATARSWAARVRRVSMQCTLGARSA
jgi:hypothetical protein